MKSYSSKGPSPRAAGAALILIHGRGASAADILGVYDALDRPALAALAPEAPGGTWYPYSFLAPIEQNQPHLDHALQQIDELVQHVLDEGVPAERLGLLGFSQGACLSLEYAIRNPRRYGAVMALTGGYIGPEGMTRDDAGSFDHTPIFIGANDPDPHVPFTRVEESAALVKKLQADVEVRRYPGLPHAVNDDEIEVCRKLIDAYTATD